MSRHPALRRKSEDRGSWVVTAATWLARLTAVAAFLALYAWSWTWVL